jgi:site-specific DNA-cytosine methylase
MFIFNCQQRFVIKFIIINKRNEFEIIPVLGASAYKQFGNCVAIPVIQVTAKKITKLIKGE